MERVEAPWRHGLSRALLLGGRAAATRDRVARGQAERGEVSALFCNFSVRIGQIPRSFLGFFNVIINIVYKHGDNIYSV